jgi:hypothetical protein
MNECSAEYVRFLLVGIERLLSFNFEQRRMHNYLFRESHCSLNITVDISAHEKKKKRQIRFEMDALYECNCPFWQ